ncbi:MAG: Small MutS-related domain-containing protein [Candidatus Tokpelaia sp. JSC189]|nr:MAG: Small MutS-related domain-containing protein [Candidatus Tokpelaia sp. JSC189]
MKHSRYVKVIQQTILSDPLCSEDRMLWETAIRDVRPFSSFQPEKDASNPRLQIKEDNSSAAKVPPPVKNMRSYMLNAFDSTVHRKIAQGRLNIDARVDLHGLTQRQAYSLLLHFMQLAQYRGLRHVLVITGKGTSSGSDGILRQMVPHWLETISFRLCINAFESAARHHGGHGALYIKLRRLPSGHVP